MPHFAPALVLCGTVLILTVLTTGEAASHAAASGRAGTIAFIRMENHGPYGGRLFVVHPNGSGLRQLTPSGTRVYSYAWSPDGSVIAYIDGRLSLWLVRPDGGARRLLLPTSRLSSISLAWSPNGAELAIASAGSDASPQTARCGLLYLVPIASGQPRLLTATGNCAVAWSPRANEIAYNDAGGGIFAVRPDGTGRRRIAQEGGGGTWSADGKQLAFGVAIHVRNGITDRYHAFGVANADGTKFHVVTTHAYNEYGVAWSPRGPRILYGRAGDKGIYIIGSDGRNNRRITRDAPPDVDWGALAWAPNGGSIVYTAGPTTNTDLYVIGIDGRDKRRLTDTRDIDIAPSWVSR